MPKDRLTDEDVAALKDLVGQSNWQENDAAIQQAISQALAALKDRLPEALITAQKRSVEIISTIGRAYPESLHILDSLLDWPYWEVQVAAANALGTLRRSIPDATIQKLSTKRQMRTPRSVWMAVDDALAEILAEDSIED